MKSMVFFNNKGGVGKTTLACNAAAWMAQHLNKRVLVVDGDPQCNATQAILSDDECSDIYFNRAGLNTIYDYLLPLEDGDPNIIADLAPAAALNNRFNVDLIPGHPGMSIVEDRLSSAWSQVLSRDTPGFRVTNWCTQLLNAAENDYDLVVFDVGPSLGALNRTIILASDFIVTPFGCDIFSLLGIQNISSWISSWNAKYMEAIESLQRDNARVLEKYQIISDTSNKFRVGGFSIQQYVQRKFKEGARPVKAYDEIMQEIPSTFAKAMKFLFPDARTTEQLSLGHIPFLYSLVPLAQAAKAPIHGLTGTDKLVGSQYGQVTDYKKIIAAFCEKLLSNVGAE